MNAKKDYYRILGVLNDAEDIVIRAAYKALAQRYHPDRWAGEKIEAERRMAEINEAYAVLSDPKRRQDYDLTLQKTVYEEKSSSAQEENAENGISEISRDWAIAAKYHPEIEEVAGNLRKLSKSLSFSFMLYLLENKEFKKSTTVANEMESKWLMRFFGKNRRAQSLARELILNGQIDAAKELNEAIRVLGEADKSVIEKISGYLKPWKSNADKRQKLAQKILYSDFERVGELKALLSEYGQLVKRRIEYKLVSREFCLGMLSALEGAYEVEGVGTLSKKEFLDWIRSDALSQ